MLDAPSVVWLGKHVGNNVAVARGQDGGDVSIELEFVHSLRTCEFEFHELMLVFAATLPVAVIACARPHSALSFRSEGIGAEVGRCGRMSLEPDCVGEGEM